jgi:hypothetical protein
MHRNVRSATVDRYRAELAAVEREISRKAALCSLFRLKDASGSSVDVLRSEGPERPARPLDANAAGKGLVYVLPYLRARQAGVRRQFAKVTGSLPDDQPSPLQLTTPLAMRIQHCADTCRDAFCQDF